MFQEFYRQEDYSKLENEKSEMKSELYDKIEDLEKQLEQLQGEPSEKSTQAAQMFLKGSQCIGKS